MRAHRTTCCTRYSRGSVSVSDLSFVEVAEKILSSVVQSQGCGAVDVFAVQELFTAERAEPAELFVLSEGLRPSDSPTRALALRSRGSLAVLARTPA